MAEPDPLSVLLRDAAGGRFPPADGTVRVLASPPGPVGAVVAFTAHNVIAADVDQGEILQHLPNQDPGAPMRADFLAWLAGRLRTHAGMLDLVMVAPAPDPADDLPELVRRGDLLFAQISPGNVASVRTFLAAGYRPICAEVLFLSSR